jgi:hypothetical protein
LIVADAKMRANSRVHAKCAILLGTTAGEGYGKLTDRTVQAQLRWRRSRRSPCGRGSSGSIAPRISATLQFSRSFLVLWASPEAVSSCNSSECGTAARRVGHVFDLSDHGAWSACHVPKLLFEFADVAIPHIVKAIFANRSGRHAEVEKMLEIIQGISERKDDLAQTVHRDHI